MKYILLFLLFLTQAIGQSGTDEPSRGIVSIGLKGGIPLDPTGSDDRTKVRKERWIAGPTVEVRLSSHFAIGADALYRNLGISTLRSIGAASFFTRSTTAHWEFPAFLKYRFGIGPMRPFVLGGVAFERAGISGSSGCTGDATLCGQTGTSSGVKSTRGGSGFLVGGGLEMRISRVAIAPEFRYTRWARGYFAAANANQPAILLGIRF